MIDKSVYGPWAVVAGGSEGVGASFAHRLADAGINLVLVARKPGPLRQTADEVRAKGVEVRTLELDLLDPGALASIRKATDDVEVGLLIFNAGANSYGHEFVSSDLDRVQGVIDLNITAQLALSHHFGASMKERGRGGIMLVGSLSGYLGQAQISIYSAAKAFSRVFAEGLWLELEPYGVHVLELVLGVTRTPAMERAGLRMDLPGLRVAEPDDVAEEGPPISPTDPCGSPEATRRRPRSAAASPRRTRTRRPRGVPAPAPRLMRGPLTIPGALDLAATTHPRTEAVVDDEVRLTYAQLRHEALTVTRSLLALGVRRGDRIALWAPNSHRWVVAALAVAGAGAILVPVNTRYKGDEARGVLEKSRTRLLLVENGFLGNDYLAMLGTDATGETPVPGLPDLLDVVTLGGPAHSAARPWEAFVELGSRVPEDEAVAQWASVRPDDVSDLLFTSGTTGRPKEC